MLHLAAKAFGEIPFTNDNENGVLLVSHVFAEEAGSLSTIWSEL